MSLTPKQEKLLILIQENIGNKNSTLTMGQMLIEAGYSEETAKTPRAIFETDGIKKATEDLVKKLEDKRRMAITHITEDKMERSAIRDLVNVVDMFTKNIQLLTGKETSRDTLNLQISETIAKKNDTHSFTE